MHTLAMDVRFAFRTMFKNARVTILAALTLALGIGRLLRELRFRPTPEAWSAPRW
jgi:hypothetical protein